MNRQSSCGKCHRWVPVAPDRDYILVAHVTGMNVPCDSDDSMGGYPSRHHHPSQAIAQQHARMQNDAAWDI